MGVQGVNEASVAEMQTKREEKSFTAENAKQPSRNQKIARSPSSISPVAGERKEGALARPVLGSRFQISILGFRI
jgi:hypothetical protein